MLKFMLSAKHVVSEALPQLWRVCIVKVIILASTRARGDGTSRYTFILGSCFCFFTRGCEENSNST